MYLLLFWFQVNHYWSQHCFWLNSRFSSLKKVCYSSGSNLRPFEDHCFTIFGKNRLIELQKYELSTLRMGLGSMWVILYESRDGMIATVLKIPWYFPYWILSHFVSSWTHRGGLLNGSKFLFRNISKFLDFSRFKAVCNVITCVGWMLLKRANHNA